MSLEVKYGRVRGPSVITDEWPIAASQVFTNTGGKFVRVDTNNRLVIAGSGITDILGWAKIGVGFAANFTSSATAGQDNAEVDISHLAVYVIPADANPANVRGETCDLIVNSNIQQADIGESNEDILKILAANETDDTVDVHLFTPNITASGVV